MDVHYCLLCHVATFLSKYIFKSPPLSCSLFLLLYRSEFLLTHVCWVTLSDISLHAFSFLPTHPFPFPFMPLTVLISTCVPPDLSMHSLSDVSLLSLLCPLRMIQWIGVVNASLTRQGTTEHWIRIHSQLIITHMAPIQLASICFIDCQGQKFEKRCYQLKRYCQTVKLHLWILYSLPWVWNSRQLRKHLFYYQAYLIKGAWFSLPILSHVFPVQCDSTRGVKRWGEGWVREEVCTAPYYSKWPKGHTWSLALGEITAQDTKGKVVSSRASFSPGLYLKQHLPHLNAVALSLCRALHWKGLKTPKPGKCCKYKSVGSTGGVQDREWLDITAESRQGRVLRRYSGEEV